MTWASTLEDGQLVVLEATQTSTAYAVRTASRSISPAETPRRLQALCMTCPSHFLLLQIHPQAGEASPAFLYLTNSRAPRVASEQQTVLEVVASQGFVGLRSPFLGGLYMRARKKAPQLVFASERLGVYEQWQVGGLCAARAGCEHFPLQHGSILLRVHLLCQVEPLYQGVLQLQSPTHCVSSRQ
jgi:hypothetical protein